MPTKRARTSTGERRVRRRYNRATVKKRPIRRYMRGNKGFAKRVKDVILKTAETKYLSRAITDTNATQSPGLPLRYQLQHNTITQYNIFNNTAPDAVKHPIPTQGDGDGNRNGDEIYSTGLMIRGSVSIFIGNKRTKVRLYMMEYNDQQGTPTTYNELFHNVTGSVELDSFQHDRFPKIKYLGTYKALDPVNDDSGANVNINFKKWIPMKRKLTFKQDDSPAVATGIKNKFSLLVIPYNNIGTAQGFHVGDIVMHVTHYYKDP